MMCGEDRLCVWLDKYEENSNISNRLLGGEIRVTVKNYFTFQINSLYFASIGDHTNSQKIKNQLTSAPFISLNTTPLNMTSDEGSSKLLCSNRQPSCLNQSIEKWRLYNGMKLASALVMTISNTRCYFEFD